MSNMVVNTNVLALNSHRSLKNVGEQQSKASGRLSSGMRINSAADDAAGLAISEKMRAQIRGLDMASKNTQDGISLIQTAEGGMQEINNMLQRMRELIDYASNDTNEHNAAGTGDRQKIQDELNQLTEEIDSMAERVEFNKKRLINGSFADTTADLSRAQGMKDTATLDKTAGDARFEALISALGTPVTYDVSSATPPVTSVTAGTGSGAMLALGTAQANLQTSIDGAYKTALTTYTTASVTYEGLMKEYDVAKNQLLDAMSQANIASTSGIQEGHLSVQSAQYVGPDTASALTSAIIRYASASSALGVDELRLSIAKGETNGLFLDTDARFTGRIAASTAVETSMSSASKKTGMLAYQNATDAFQTAKLAHQGLVDLRDTEQSKVDALNTMITDARRELTSANARFNASDLSYNAAVNASKENSARPLHFQVGANANQSLIMSIGSVKTDTLGIGDGNGNSRLNVLRNSGANITAQLDVLDQALSYVSTERAKLGAAQNRMEYTMKSLDISSENLSASESRIRDADMAKEMMNVTKSNVLQQAAISMLSQANQAPQSVLQLLR